MFRSLPTIIRVLVVADYSKSTICAFVQDTVVNNYILDECTYFLVALLCNNEHFDDGQQ